MKEMLKKAGASFVAAIFLAVLAAVGYWMLFSNFAIADDEGYILISAQNYLSKGGLYATVYSQYGPVFYLLLDALHHVCGTIVDHTSARLLTLGCWLGTAACCATLVWRQTTSRSLSLFTLSATFLYLYFITDEPFHPGSLIIFVLSLSLCITIELIARGRLSEMAAVAGVTGAILLLTKINVGIFYLFGVAAWAMNLTSCDRFRRVSGPSIIITLVSFAVFLMHALLREPWVQIYLAVFAASAIALITAQNDERMVKINHVSWFAIAGSTTGLVICGSIWLRGTSFSELYEGVWLRPLLHPLSYSYPVDWRPGTLVIAGLSLCLALAYRSINRRISDEQSDLILVTLRLLQVGALLTGVALLMNFRVVGTVFSYVAPLIWTWVIPLKKNNQAAGRRVGRSLLASVLLLQYLHAYPVGGSQESWGTFLFFPLLASGLGEVREWLAMRRVPTVLSAQWWSVVSLLLLTVSTLKVGWTAIASHQIYSERFRLGLPGAADLRLPESQRTAYRILALNAAVHTDMLFSLPGMFSFNLWTDIPTPTGKNATLWFTLLTDPEQRAIIDTIKRSPRAGLIIQESLLQLMRTNGIVAEGPLQEYLKKNFIPILRVEGFTFLVKTDRATVPFNIAEVRTRRDSNQLGSMPDTEMNFNLIHDGTPITSIELRSMTAAPSSPIILNAANAQVDLISIDSNGRRQAKATSVKTPWPLRFQGPNQLSIRFNSVGFDLSSANTVLHLKGSNNEILGEIRLGE